MENPSDQQQDDHFKKRLTDKRQSRFTDRKRKQHDAKKHTLGGF